jgi:hypothetical protein
MGRHLWSVRVQECKRHGGLQVSKVSMLISQQVPWQCAFHSDDCQGAGGKTVPKGWIKEGAPYRRSRGPPTVTARDDLDIHHSYMHRQLGLPWTGAVGFIGSSMPSAVTTSQGGPGTQGTVPFSITSVACTGSEASILDCPYSTSYLSSCWGWDAGRCLVK